MTETIENSAAAAPEPRTLSSRRILWQLSVFLLGFLLLLALHGFFTFLIDDLARQTVNERARLFVGEQIVSDIRLVESGVYRMATTLGVRGQQRVGHSIVELIEGIRYNLDVLRKGGVARQLIHLNLEGRDRMIKEVPYNPSQQAEQGYILEIIDLTPKLQEIEDKVAELARLLERREVLHKHSDQAGLVELERRIKVFLKKLPPLFIRLTENANRMFFESHQRLAQIEKRIAEQSQSYRMIELAMVLTIIVSVMLLGLKFARQIERSNKQLADARDRMREAKEEAERANRAKSEFLSRMSHELRTPLNAVLGFSQLLVIDPHLTEEQRDGLEEIDKAGRHLLELINEILDLAKIEAGRLELEHIEYSITEVADEIVGIMAARAHDKGLELHAFVSPQLPAVMFGDPTRLKQVLLNLLGNAVKFTERGDVGLRIEADADKRGILFQISDTGIGFDEQGRQRLFQPFTQADESTTRKFGGSGLGLVICKELVQAMGGHIGAESTPGRGSRFWFELPAEGSSEPDDPGDERFAGMPVLIVEDRPVVSGVLEDYLSALGASPTVTVDRPAALAALRQAQSFGEPYRLMLVEADLEDDAAALARELAADSGLRRPALALLTPSSRSSVALGTNAYELCLGKPVSLQRLRELLQQAEAPVRTAPRAVAAQPVVVQSVSDVRILLVEDQLPNQIVARSMLKRLGVQVECVANGQAAVDAVVSDSFDLVFMDMQMPVMDGVEATRLIRRHESEQALPRIPVVAMTANAMEDDRDTCLQAGMDDHLPKPISLESVDEQLQRWIPGYVTPESQSS